MKLLWLALVLLVSGFLFACGNGGSNETSIKEANSSSEVEKTTSDKLACPENLSYEATSIEEVALEKACAQALYNNMSADMTKVTVISEDTNAQRASVEVYATEYGCKFCPEEVVAEMDLFVNANGQWQVRNSEVRFLPTAESELARTQKQTAMNQTAIDQAANIVIGQPQWSTFASYRADVSGDYSNEVWIVIRMQTADGRTFDYIQNDPTRYTQPTVPSGSYKFYAIDLEDGFIDENEFNSEEGVKEGEQAQATLIAYKLVTIKYSSVGRPIDIESDWINLVSQ